MSNEKRDNPNHIYDSFHLKMDYSICFSLIEEHSSEPALLKRHTLDETNLTASKLPPKDSCSDISGFDNKFCLPSDSVHFWEIFSLRFFVYVLNV